jgi:zinc D-Ala-D-Ala carboxypeptidase
MRSAWKLRYFKPPEFACKHCAANLMEDGFLLELDELRHRFGRPLIITSGYRCPAYNAQVSSTGLTGPHTTGCAADIGVAHADAYDVLRLALAMGFSGIGVAQKGADRFIHLDKLPPAADRPRPTVWTY